MKTDTPHDNIAQDLRAMGETPKPQPMQSAKVEIRYRGNVSDLHAHGAKSYRGAWLSANMATAEFGRSRTDVSKPAMKELLSLVTLRILMALQQDGHLKSFPPK